MAIKYKVSLSDLERSELTNIIRKNNSTGLKTKRAFILLACDAQKLSNREIATTYGVSVRSVEKLRKRFVEEGFSVALSGKQWGGYKPKVFDGRVEAHLIALRCSEPPAGYNKWTLRLLADRMVSLEYVPAISHTSVGDILKKTNLSLGKSRVG
jgi:transposase